MYPWRSPVTADAITALSNHRIKCVRSCRCDKNDSDKNDEDDTSDNDGNGDDGGSDSDDSHQNDDSDEDDKNGNDDMDDTDDKDDSDKSNEDDTDDNDGNDENDDSNKDDKWGQWSSVWTSEREEKCENGKKVYPSLPKFTLVDDKSVLNALCPHKTAQEGPKRSPVEDYYCFLSTRGGFEGPSETLCYKVPSGLPPSCLAKTEVFGDPAANWTTDVATNKVILYK